jgi:hypothetical protein
MRRLLVAAFILSATLVLPQRLLFAQDAYDDVDLALQGGNLDSAKSLIGNLSSGPRRDAYQSVYDVLFAKQAYDAAVQKWNASNKSDDDLAAVFLSIKQFSDAWKALIAHGPLPVRNGLVSDLNQLLRTMNDYNASFVNLKARREAEVQQKAAEAKAQRDAENARMAQQAAQQAQEAQARADEEAANQARQERNDKIDKFAKKLGYKGLNEDVGIAHFLANSQRDGNLESGLGYVFYTKLSPTEEAIDKMWKLTQVVEGWEIYSWMDEVRQFTIATKARKGLPMEGQQLKSGFYVFKGNKQFTMALNGVTKIIQEFEPVNIPEPETAPQQ